MNMHPELPSNDGQTLSENVTPSLSFVNAISEFFDTDPSDLLVELGYYTRDEEVPTLVG